MLAVFTAIIMKIVPGPFYANVTLKLHTRADGLDGWIGLTKKYYTNVEMELLQVNIIPDNLFIMVIVSKFLSDSKRLNL
jgi:hypothetical protein